MSIELIAGIVGLLLALVGGGVGWGQIKRHGAEKQKRKRAEEDRDEALGRLKTVHQSDLTPDQRPDFIDKL